MNRVFAYSAAGMLAILVSTAATAAAPSPALEVTVEGIPHTKPIPADYAVCLPTADGKSNAEGKNMRPSIRWSGAPKETASFAVFVMDPDVPADFTDAGKEGKIIAKNAKRQDFFHYGVVGIPANRTELAGGKHSSSPTAGTALVNDMGSNKYVTPATAYGGPCPPWNDQRVHHYHFIVLALDKDAPVDAPPVTDCNDPSCRSDTAKAAFDRLIDSSHVLAKGTSIGTYTLNPAVKGK